jgi:hypothetical protein
MDLQVQAACRSAGTTSAGPGTRSFVAPIVPCSSSTPLPVEGCAWGYRSGPRHASPQVTPVPDRSQSPLRRAGIALPAHFCPGPEIRI